MKNLTPELIAKAKAAKSAEELLVLAKANNVELTEEEAKTYFEQLNANGVVSDDELDVVAGGILSCPDNDLNVGDVVRVLGGKKCENCGSDIANICVDISSQGGTPCVRCIKCGYTILPSVNSDLLVKI